MAQQLQGKKIAALVTHGFEQVELTEPRKALLDAGAHVDIVSPESGQVKGWNHTEWGDTVTVDRALTDARADEYDGLLIDARAVSFVKAFVDAGKPIAAICHGPWTLIEADGVRGRTMTSYPSLRSDLENAGAAWVDQEVVVDRGMVTSRKPDDIPAFNRKMIEEFAEGVHTGAMAAARQTIPAGGL
jgi:protease I